MEESNRSKAAKLRWKDVPIEEKKRRMVAIAKKRWKTVTVDERRKWGIKLSKLKKLKNGNKRKN